MGKRFPGLYLIVLSCLLNACGGGGGNPPGATKISSYNSVESHSDDRRGQNCMDCHYAGNNPYVYQVAGTVYQVEDTTAPYPNATIYLRIGPNDTDPLVGRIEVDGNGNFYTADNLDLSAGVYPSIAGVTGDPTLHMSNFITHGQCNGCHGETTLPLYAGQIAQPVVQRVSANGLSLSHSDERRGTDCAQCHEEYAVAGTVYDYNLQNFYANGKIQFYTQAVGQGDLIYTLEIDANGNFYTTDAVDFSTPLYPVLENAAGDHWDYMPSSITQGACSRCHSVSTLALFEGEIVNQLQSRHGATNSHSDERRGQDCTSCHYQGNNAYVYSLAGSVYQQNDPTAYFPNATIKFYSEADGNGQLLASLEVDANGNFYSTDAIDLSNGVYPMISGGGLQAPLSMPSSTTSGGCNACHDGVGTNRILAPGDATQTTSLHGTTYSHSDGRRGVDCLGCHNIGGNNPYQFSVAGTVYDISLRNIYPNASISLYSGSNKSGELIATIEVDANGNFYTTEPLDLGKGKNGIYASIVGSQPTSLPIEMNTRTDNGGCSNSSCHGVTRPPIYATD